MKMDSTGELQLKVADFGFAGYLTDEPFTCPKGTLEYDLLSLSLFFLSVSS